MLAINLYSKNERLNNSLGKLTYMKTLKKKET